MYAGLIDVKYIGDYKLELTFENGKTGIVDFQKYHEKGGIFAPLKDLSFFKRFAINRELGIITWNNEIDIAPETLYSEATKEPLPKWVEKESRLQKSA
ncbi:MAG TPA: DUF2442 domain-containing protein [Desulfobaccales bacterium]